MPVLARWHYLKAQHDHSSSRCEKLPTGAGLDISMPPSSVKDLINHYYLCDTQQKLTPWQIR